MDEVSKGQTISGIFLVAGTCIGGGMLALPVATGVMGFLPSIVVMGICGVAMMVTALLFLEVSLWLEEGAHVFTMASRLLGPLAKRVSWLLFLFISYGSVVAYTAGGGVQVADVLSQELGWAVSKAGGCTLFIFVFGMVIYFGSAIVGRVNAILFTAMIGAYLLLIGTGAPEIKGELLTTTRWGGCYLALPLLLTSFSFQTMVPSLTPYLKRHVGALRLAIVGGTVITFIVYFIWEALILGIVPLEGKEGLAAALQAGEPATRFLRAATESAWVSTLAEFFGFFAIVTSFLGMSLGLFDFLADGLHIKKAGMGNVILGVLIVVPTLLLAIFFERAFIVALDTTGGFGDSILNGIIPVLMVWVGRYRMGFEGSYRLFGGRSLLVALGIFYLCCLAVEIVTQTGLVTSAYDQMGTLDY